MSRELVSVIALCLAVVPIARGQPDPVAERLRRIEELGLDSLKRELEGVVAERGARHPDLLPLLFAIRDTYMVHGAYVAATPFQERALAITEEMHGRDGGVTLTALHNLARLHVLSKDYASARRVAERLRSTVERVIGTEHNAYGMALTTEGKVLLAGGDVAAASERLEAALAILTGNMGPAAHEATETMLLLAEAGLRRGRVRRPEQLLVLGLTIRSEAGDFEQDEEAAIYMAPFMSVLGALYTAAGLYDKAEDLLTSSLEAYETALGADRPDLEPVLVHMATLYAAKGEAGAAAGFRARAARLHADNLGFAFIATAEPYDPIAAIRAARDPSGLFASSVVGDRVEYSMDGQPAQRLEIVRATPALVVIATSHRIGDGWSVLKEEMVRRDIGFEEFHGVGSWTRVSCPFVTGVVECRAVTATDSYDGQSVTLFFAPDVVPLGGLLRSEMGEHVLMLTGYRQGGQTVAVPGLEGFPELAQPMPDVRSEEDLIAAVKRGDRDAVEDALDRGMDANAADGELLGLAAFEGHTDVAELLIARGARVRSEDLIRAAGNGSVELARLLVEHGADVNVDRLGPRTTTPLLVAAENGHTELVEYLLEQGADPRVTDGAGVTTLIAAAAAGSAELVHRFLALGLNVDQPTRTGATAILEAARAGSAEAVRVLLDAGADARDTTNTGVTTLYLAARSGSVDLGELLIRGGAAVNGATDTGRTALMWAAESGHADFVRLLIREGADVNQENEFGYTALKGARARGHPEIVEILLAAGAKE